MTEIQIQLEDHPTAEDADFAFRQLVVFNEARVGPASARQLAVFARRGTEIVGALLGITHWNWFSIRYLWVAEPLRRQGLGRRLMLAAEREARTRGCDHVHLDTFSFQALPFYERLGYTAFGRVEDFPPGHSRIFLQKRDLQEVPLAGPANERRTDLPDGDPSVRVRILTPADADAYRALRLQALDEQPPAFGSLPEEEPDLAATGARLVESDDRCFLGGFQGEQLIGILRFSRYAAANEKHRAYLAGLYVLPPFRQQGCGRALVGAALRRASGDPGIRRINLTVVTRQEAAIRLYESFGFRIYGTERETFSHAGKFHDEHLMTLEFGAGRP